MNKNDSIDGESSTKSNRCDRPQLTCTHADDVQWVLPLLYLQPHFRVLDVAAGTGQLSRAIAPDVQQIISLDSDRAQLNRGLKTARQQGITNIAIQQGRAENLPYANDTFDLVITRFGLHHFDRPDSVIAEMKRVCRLGGQVVVMDRVAPGNSYGEIEYNRLEKLRDSSHVQIFKLYELKQLFRDSGLSIVRTNSRDFSIDFQSWIDLKLTAPELEYKFYVDLKQDLEGNIVTGMRPFWQDDRLLFLQIIAIVMGQK
jgi:SAM-dependent methyltransferase